MPNMYILESHCKRFQSFPAYSFPYQPLFIYKEEINENNEITNKKMLYLFYLQLKNMLCIFVDFQIVWPCCLIISLIAQVSYWTPPTE